MLLRASPIDMRKAMAMADGMKQMGILFVPMPCANTEEFLKLSLQSANRLEELAVLAEQPPEGTVK